ncbi:FecR family protein [Flavobacterium sp.]|uniref:FecR family protein n=1 Tax=Flavobacterium sp. TaxID=239 RepID=UPI003C65FDC2
MKVVDKIVLLAQKITVSILNRDFVDKSEIKSFFDDNDSDHIVERLTNKKSRKQRNELHKIVEQTKQENWQALKEIMEPNSSSIDFKFWTKIAAAVVLFLGISFVYIDSNKNVITNNEYVCKNEIILKSADGTLNVIKGGITKNIVDVNGKQIASQIGMELNYSTISSLEDKISSLIYNELTIPYGKKMKLVLSDGTVVHLNSGSTIKFPIQFVANGNRTVFLKGEAFFDVTKDKKHPFIVNAANLDIRVLGTKFNVSAYSEDQIINTVLVEGAVSLYDSKTKYDSKKAVLLTPGNKACWNKSQQQSKIEKVDTSLYTSWMDGKIIFEHMTFNNIIQKLERHYNVTIVNNNQKLANESFTASFDVETIEQVLNTFNKSYPLKYSIKQDKIIIN